MIALAASSVAAFVYLNIDQTYPMNEACNTIRAFKARHNRYPAEAELGRLGIPRAKLFSVRKYRTAKDDFLFYTCPTELGPCEVCSAKEGPYVDEI